jgi:excisionase family DNA binding protein
MTDLTTKQAARRLNLSHTTVRLYLKRRFLKGEKRGRDWFIPESEVERYAAERRKPGRPAPLPPDPAAQAAARRVTLPDA